MRSKGSLVKIHSSIWERLWYLPPSQVQGIEIAVDHLPIDLVRCLNAVTSDLRHWM